MDEDSLRRRFSDARARVLDRFSSLEARIDNLLFFGIDPADDRKKFVRRVLLNTSILPFSNKVKLLRHLATEFGWDGLNKRETATALSGVAEIRNQFAHAIGIDKSYINFPEKWDDVVYVERMIIEKVTGSGKLEEIKFDDAMDQFMGHYRLVSEIIETILSSVSLPYEPYEGTSDFLLDPDAE